MEINREIYGKNCLGQVIRIISKKELIVDVGDDYLTIGDKVIVYAVGDEIFDLNGNSLGVYEHDKVTLEVVTTTSAYSICATEKITESVSPMLDYSNLFSKSIVTQAEFKVNDKDIEGIKIENKYVVVKGDLVKKA